MIEFELIEQIFGLIVISQTIIFGYIIVKYVHSLTILDKTNLINLLQDRRALYSIEFPKLFRMINKNKWHSYKYTTPDIDYIFMHSDIKELSIKRQNSGYFVKVFDDGTLKNGEKK